MKNNNRKTKTTDKCIKLHLKKESAVNLLLNLYTHTIYIYSNSICFTLQQKKKQKQISTQSLLNVMQM